MVRLKKDFFCRCLTFFSFLYIKELGDCSFTSVLCMKIYQKTCFRVPQNLRHRLLPVLASRYDTYVIESRSPWVDISTQKCSKWLTSEAIGYLKRSLTGCIQRGWKSIEKHLLCLTCDRKSFCMSNARKLKHVAMVAQSS